MHVQLNSAIFKYLISNKHCKCENPIFCFNCTIFGKKYVIDINIVKIL